MKHAVNECSSEPAISDVHKVEGERSEAIEQLKADPGRWRAGRVTQRTLTGLLVAQR